MKSLLIQNRGDRLGANITSYICQIIIAHKRGLYIHKINNKIYNKSIFINSLNNLIDNINQNNNMNVIESYGSNSVKLNIDDWCHLNMVCCKEIDIDIYSYFQKYFKHFLINNIEKINTYNINYNWGKNNLFAFEIR